MTSPSLTNHWDESGVIDTMLFGCLPSGFQMAQRLPKSTSVGTPLLASRKAKKRLHIPRECLDIIATTLF